VSSLRIVGVCSVLALSLSGCGNALYAMRAGKVSSELQLAEQDGAAESAPYDYYFADEHLRKARSEASESDFGDALALLDTAEEYTRRAREQAARGRSDPLPAAGPEPAAPTTSARAVPSNIARLEQLALSAERDGALRCAPRELAVGRSQLEFAAIEDAQGYASRAREHLRLAEQNVQAARLRSDPARCADERSKPQTLEHDR
jgi:hypothetical protein